MKAHDAQTAIALDALGSNGGSNRMRQDRRPQKRDNVEIRRASRTKRSNSSSTDHRVSIFDVGILALVLVHRGPESSAGHREGLVCRHEMQHPTIHVPLESSILMNRLLPRLSLPS
jgi:hypothetical protein